MNAIEAAVQNANTLYKAGLDANHDAWVRAQDIAHQLRVIANDNTDDDRRERTILIGRLVALADAVVNQTKGE